MALDPRDIVKARPVYNSIVLIGVSIGMGVVVLAGMALWFDGVSDTSLPPRTASLVLAVFVLAAAASVAASLFAGRAALARASAAESLDEALSRRRGGVIVAYALGQSPAGLGFAWMIVGGSAVWMPAFFGGALLAVVMAIPWPGQWEEWLASLPHVSS